MSKTRIPPQPLPPIKPRPVLDVNMVKDWMTRLVIGHPVTGMVRVEWMMGRFGQTIPTNWSHMDLIQFMSPFIPMRYQISDAENLIAKAVVESDAEWLLSWEHDNIPPNNALVMLNEYMIEKKVPVVGGLYFTKSIPAEPMVYRGIGTGYFADWKIGDKVWCTGIPFGFTLIHGSIIKAMWKESPEYIVNNQVTRRVFEFPAESFNDPGRGISLQRSGTSDLAWCKRVMQERFFEKAGWPEYQKMKNPFLIDTNIFVRHIDNDGVQHPIEVPKRFAPDGNPKEIF